MLANLRYYHHMALGQSSACAGGEQQRMAATQSSTRLCMEGTIIIRSRACVGTGLHCTDLVSAHCQALVTGDLDFFCTNRSSALSLQPSRAQVIFIAHAP